MDKNMLGFLLVFAMLIGTSLVLANADQISPTVVQAEAEMAMGTTAADAVEHGLVWIGKVILGGLFAGVLLAVYAEGRKAYRTWTRHQQARRWQAGPNAQWQSRTPSVPRLKREDLMLMALMGQGQRMSAGSPTRSGVGLKRVSDAEDEIELEF